MKPTLQQLIQQAIKSLPNAEALQSLPIQIERSKDAKNGDFACNIALMLAKQLQRKPREIAELIVANIASHEQIDRIEIAGPGFINFFLSQNAVAHVVNEILAARTSYGHSHAHQGTMVHLEFVSSNPTGPLHVGHGRSAAYGASLANLLEAVGYKVQREYYVNDAGRQMDILATSIWLRYMQLCGAEFNFPVNGYKGDYIKDIAQQLRDEHKQKLMHPL